MEGYGLFKECRGTYYTIPCLIIKSICDWAVMKNFKTQDVFEKICNEGEVVEEKEQETLKDRIQAYSAYQAFRALDILISNNIFEESIYESIVKYIKEFQGHAIYADQIKEAINEIMERSMCNINITDKFVIAVIREMLNCKLISWDDATSLNETINDDTKEIDNWIFAK